VKLTENDKIRRVEITAENLKHDIDIWRQFIFIDETSFETGRKSQTRVRRFDGTRYDEDDVQEVQTSGWNRAMCCACFSFQVVGPIMRSQGNFTSKQYGHFFENQIIPHAEENFTNSDLYSLG
jgi:hypothetical protein